MRVRSLFRAALVSTLVLAGCGGGGGSSQTVPSASSTSAFVRFVNASPDAGYPDPSAPAFFFTVGTANVIAGGTIVATVQPGLAVANGSVVPAASASGYVPVSPSVTSVSFQSVTAVTGATAGPYTISVQAGKRYTAVLAGSQCTSGVKLLVFEDPAVTAAPTLRVYHVAPDLAPSYTFGAVTLGSQRAQLGSVSLGNAASAPLSASVASNFTAYVADASGTTLGTLAPSAVYALDAGNTLPFSALSTFSVFVTDPAISNNGAISCGSETPISPGTPSIVGVLNQ